MSAEQFPLCKQAGLSVQKWRVPKYYTAAVTGLSNETVEIESIPAADVERWLEQALVVNIHDDHGHWIQAYAHDRTHTARLVCIQPIVRNTAEGLLREMIDLFEDKPPLGPKLNTCEWIKRARKLLEGK